ncbi:MAG: ATP synthase F1 subunit gamma [Flavobacteriaceae bacterium]|nr:ATP synthase F1 subunit gamma [Flavobacteriaceae bacterium]
MANLKELRNRISSVSSTMQITSAMKMVSAAKLSKAQDVITKMRPFAEKLSELLRDLNDNTDTSKLNNPLTEVREVKNVLFVVVSSNKGLAGAFNSNIVKKVKSLAIGEYKDQNIALSTVGKKAHEVLENKSYIIDGDHDELLNDPSYENIADLMQLYMNDYTIGTYDKIVVIYNHFINAGMQVVKAEQLLPLENTNSESGEKQANSDYIYEPNHEEIINDLIPKALKMHLYKAIRDSIASEHGARMTAMHKATDNATELRDDLKLSYNKVRQAAITNEILEIVAGADALN